MKDISTYLKTKYFQLLKDVVQIPVFIDYVPNELAEDAYILITSPASVDASSMNSSNTDTSIVVSIYTKATVSNNDDVAGANASLIYSTIYPSQVTVLDLTGGGFGKTKVSLVNDITPEAIQTDSEIFINRNITFRHSNIKHN